MPLFPILLAVHVALAIGLFLPSILLPFAFRGGRPGRGASGSQATRRGTTEPIADPGSGGRFVGLLLRLQGGGSIVIGGGLAITGLGLVAVLGTRLLAQPWLVAALVLYSTTMAIAFFVQRPGLRSLVGLLSGTDERTWRGRARRGRYVSYAMAGLVGTIGLLMSAKPELW